MNRFFTLLFAASCLTAFGQHFDGLTQALTTDSSIFLTSESQLSWDSAQAFATSIGGHLATFANMTENEDVVSWPPQNGGYWFGLRQDVNGAEPDEGWGWVTGESLDFTNWNVPAEPNNIGGNEECGELTSNGEWNDNPCAELRYFVVEVALHAGCTDQMACNYDPEANVDDGSCELSGCLDEDACNFDAEADCDDGSCDYSCCPGPGCCDVGTEWSWESNTCIVTNPADINLDGCVQLNDLLDLLSAFGTCAFWQCGDPIGYHGFDYATVLIGEQCWFAENLHSEQYLNGDSIEIWQNEAQWISADFGMMGVLGQSDSCFGAYGIHIQCPNPDDWLVEHGRLYNWYAVDDERGLCPNGWHVPSSYEFLALTDELGGAEVAGVMLKSVDGWIEGGNGTNSVGFNAKPSGGISAYEPNFGTSQNPGVATAFWTSTMQTNASAYMRGMIFNVDYVTDFSRVLNEGQSVRCIKDAQ